MTIVKSLTEEERTLIMRKMEGRMKLSWEECDRMWDHIEYLEGTLKRSGLLEEVLDK